jgi:hypothetical protein
MKDAIATMEFTSSVCHVAVVWFGTEDWGVVCP